MSKKTDMFRSVANPAMSYMTDTADEAAAEDAPDAEAARAPRRPVFVKDKPTRTRRAQLIFYPDDFDLAKRAADAEGVSFNEWATATLAAAARDTLESHGCMM